MENISIDALKKNPGFFNHIVAWSPLCWFGLTLIRVWISNHMPRKLQNEITYPFPKFNGATVEV